MLNSVALYVLGVFAAAGHALPASSSSVVPGKFIVSLKASADVDLGSHTQWVSEVHARNIARRAGDSTGVDQTFSFPGYQAYSGSFDEETLDSIRANPNVSYVEPELIFMPTAVITQEDASWALSQISNANPPSSSSGYHYDDSAGEGSFIYVADTGILLDHVEFEGRAQAGYSSGSPTDLLHGTYVASLAGGVTYGVAKQATIIDLQVLGNAGGSTTTVLAGLTWAVNDAISNGRVGASVINMSLGSPSVSQSLNDAVQAAIDDGIPVVVAAGNANQDAAGWSPASNPGAITVAASNQNYARWSSSNWGSAVDIFAPGERVTGASSSSNTALITDSGTSMAAPHVAGVIAYLLSLEGPRSPDEMWERLQELAIRDVIADPRGVPNLLLYNGNGL
ncbi:hypothetical protein S40293_03613 [Stachybotrys chartarum IBT 40293]|nr:hypothetical protein S40293_03613 [Stachybotrys chartarum IBT 40293]